MTDKIKLMEMETNSLIQAIQTGNLTISTIGIGRIGLPTALSFANSGLLDPYGPHAPHPQHLTTLVPLPPSRACRTSNSLLPQKGQANNPLDSIRLLCVSRALMIQFSIQNSW